ncbi:hypothetical protein [Roseovarius aquimarinus]|uniref:CTP synthetase n=1 Tax=Roseovarius aquimarinus TaxID=1229156 RepID=A0ABW7IB63_9RHOB
MDKLTVFFGILSGTAISGALIAICVALGYPALWVVLVSIVLGFSIAWPGARIAANGVRAWQGKAQDRSTRTDPTE